MADVWPVGLVFCGISGMDEESEAALMETLWQLRESGIGDRASALLRDSLDILASNRRLFSDSTHFAVAEMVSKMLFRNPSSSSVHFSEINKLVYQFFLKFLESPDCRLKGLEKCIDRYFVFQLMNLLLNSPWKEERVQVGEILELLYWKLNALRTPIRTHVGDCLCRFLHEAESHRGIKQLLQFIEKTTTMGEYWRDRAEAERLLLRLLLPLHKSNHFRRLRGRLHLCLRQYLKCDSGLAPPILHGLLRHWPRGDSRKELQFLEEFDELLTELRPQEIKDAAGPLFKRLADCIFSGTQKVAGKVLDLWNNRCFVSLVKEHSKIAIPIFLPTVYSAMEISEAAAGRVLHHLCQIDEALVTASMKDSAQKKREKKRTEMERRWRHLEQKAKQNPLYKELVAEFAKNPTVAKYIILP